MNYQEPDEASVFALKRFQEIVADLQDTLQHLGEIDEEMGQALADMKSQGLSRARLLVGHAMLNDLRGIMALASPYCPPVREKSNTSRQRAII